MKKTMIQQPPYNRFGQTKTINTTQYNIYHIGYKPIRCDSMKVMFEIDTDKGERNAKFNRISDVGQISGLKEYAGREAIVLILGPKEEGGTKS